jgi:hypothetical protein
MDGRQVLGNILEVEHRFLGPRVRRVFVPEDGPVDQFAALGVPVPNAVMARDAAASTDPASTLKNVTNSTFILPIALGIA